MAADFKFLLGFDVDNKPIDMTLQNLKLMKATLKDLEQAGSLGEVMGVTDLKQAETIINSMTESLSRMQMAGKQTISADELIREYRILAGEIDNSADEMEQLSKATKEVEKDLNRVNKEGKELNKTLSGTTKEMSFLQRTVTSVNEGFKKTIEDLRWRAVGQSINQIQGGLQTAYYFAKDLDRVMTEIRVVTGDSSDEIISFTNQAERLASSLGSTMLKFSEASVLFLQQGKNRQDAADLAEQTLIASNITGANARESAELLTSALEGFNKEAKEAANTVDIFARLGAETGSSFQEIATALSKSASSFSSAGFDLEKAASALATVSTVTRQSPEQIGTGFKTIIARLASVKEGGEDGEEAISKIEIALQRVNKELGNTGEDVISIFGADGDIKQGVEILEIIGNNWEKIQKTTSQVTQNILLEAVAGKEQANRVLALYQNWDMYTSSVQKAIDSEGYAYQQQLIYQDSLKAALNDLSNEFQILFSDVFGTDIFKDLVKGATSLVASFNELVDGGDKWLNILLPISTLFGTKIAKDIDSIGQSFLGSLESLKNMSLTGGVIYNNWAKINNLTTAERDKYSQIKSEYRERLLYVDRELKMQEAILQKLMAQEGVETSLLLKQQDKVARLQAQSAVINDLSNEGISVIGTAGKIEKFSKNILGNVSSLVLPVISGAKGFSDMAKESNTLNQKVDGGIRAVGSLASIVATGLGAGALTPFITGIAEGLTLLINVKSEAERTAEKMEELGKEAKKINTEYASAISDYTEMENTLVSIRSELDLASESGMSYADALTILGDRNGEYSEDQIKTAEAVEKVRLEQGMILEQLDPNLVYYDSMGRAIALQTSSYDDLTRAIREKRAAEAEAYLAGGANEESLAIRVAHANDVLKQSIKDLQSIKREDYNSEKDYQEARRVAAEQQSAAQAQYETLQEEVKNFAIIMSTANMELQSMNPQYREALINLYNFDDILKIMNGDVDYSASAYDNAAKGLTNYVGSLDEKQLENFNKLTMQQKDFITELFAEMEASPEKIASVLGGVEDWSDFFSNIETYVTDYSSTAERSLEGIKTSVQEYFALTKEMQSLQDDRQTAAVMGDAEALKTINEKLNSVLSRRRDIMDDLESKNVGQREFIMGQEDIIRINEGVIASLERELELREENIGIQERANAVNVVAAEEQENLKDKADETYNSLASLEEVVLKGEEGFNKLNDSAKKGLLETLREVKDEVPGLEEVIADMTDGSLDNIEALKKSWKDLIGALEESDPSIIEEFAMNSEDYFDRWKVANAELYNAMLEAYGIDLTNFKTFNEMKQEIFLNFLVAQVKSEVITQEQMHAIREAGSIEEYKLELEKRKEMLETQAKLLETTLANTNYMKTTSISAIMHIEQVAKAAAEELNALRLELSAIEGLEVSWGDYRSKVDWDAFKPVSLYDDEKMKPKEVKQKKEKKEKEVKDIEYELDILHKYEKQLEVLDNKLAKYNRAFDHAFGYDKVKNLQQQNKILEQRADLIRKEIKLIEAQTADYKKLLEQQGFKVNDVGTITNKDEVFKKLYASANAQKGAEAREAAQAQVKEIEDVFKKFEANVEMRFDMEASLNETFHDIQDKYKEGLEIEMRLVLDVSELIEQINQAERTIFKGFGQSSKAVDSLSKSFERVSNDLGAIVFNMDRIVNDPKLDAATKYEMMQANMDQFIGKFEEIQDAFEEIAERMQEVVSDSVDLVSEQIEGMQTLVGYASDLADVYLSFYGPEGYSRTTKFYDLQLKGIDQQISGTEDLIGSLEIYLDRLEEAGQKGSDAWKETKRQIASLQDDVVQLAKSQLETLQKQYDAFIESSIKKVQETLFGQSMDSLQEQMDKLDKKQKKYLDTTEKIVKVSDLYAKVQNQINQLNDPKLQEELSAQLEKQMELLREKDGLTERDLERAQLQYELLLKQNAAKKQEESAQMIGRMVRDESGNWTVEYVKDLSKIEKAQEDLSETLNKLVDFDRESLNQNKSEIMDLMSEFSSKSQDIMNKYKNDPTKMAEELQKLEQEFGKELDVLKKEREELMKNYMQSSVESIFEAAKINEKVFDVYGKDTSAALKEILKSLEDGTLSITDIQEKDAQKIADVTGMSVEEVTKALDKMFNNITDDFKEFNDIVNKVDISNISDMFDDITSQSKDMVNKITSAMKEYEKTIGDLNKKMLEQKAAIEEVNAETEKELDAMGKLIEAFGGEDGLFNWYEEVLVVATDYFNTLKERLKEVEDHVEKTDEYSKMQKALADETKGATGQVNELTKAEGALQVQQDSLSSSTQNATNKMNTFEGQLSSVNKQATSSRGSVDGLKSSIDSLRDKTVTITTVHKTVYDSSDKPSGGGGGGGGQSQAMVMDTGGYTGDRPYSGGVDGRGGIPAVLHPKELVLNKEDTPNVLEAIGLVRDLFKDGAKQKLSSLSSAITNSRSSVDNVTTNTKSVEQNYTIENVNLPNVQDGKGFVKEVELIFGNMSNNATQYTRK